MSDPFFNNMPYKVCKDRLRQYETIPGDSELSKSLATDIIKELSKIEVGRISAMDAFINIMNRSEPVNVLTTKTDAFNKLIEMLLALGLIVVVGLPPRSYSKNFSFYYVLPEKSISLYEKHLSNIEDNPEYSTIELDGKLFVPKSSCTGGTILECANCGFRFSVIRPNKADLENFSKHTCVISDKTDYDIDDK